MEVRLFPRYLAATLMPRGFEPPQSSGGGDGGGLPDMTRHFDGSVSTAIKAYEAGAEIPASGVLVQSARLSRDRGFRVFYRLQWVDGVPTDVDEIAMAPSRDASVATPDYPPPLAAFGGAAGGVGIQQAEAAVGGGGAAAAAAAAGSASTSTATDGQTTSSSGAARNHHHVGKLGRLFAQGGHETARSTLRRELSRYSSSAEVHNRPFVIRQVQVPLTEAADFVAALCVDAQYPKYVQRDWE